MALDEPSVSPGKPSRSARLHAAAQLVLGLAIACVAVVAVASDRILPRLVSQCGRLEWVPNTRERFSIDMTRLTIPEGRTWRSIELSIAIEPNEALTFLLDRLGMRYDAVRLSRSPRVPSAVLHAEDERVVDSRPLPASLTAGDGRRTLRFERRDGAILMTSGEVVAERVSARARAGYFDIVMLPPTMTDVYDRVHLGEVVLDDGSRLEARRMASRLRSPLSLSAAVVAIGLIGFPLFRRAARRAYRVQLARSPASITAGLVCLLVPLSAIAVIPRYELLSAVEAHDRWSFRVLVGVVIVVCLGFLRVRERVLRRWPGLLDRGFFQAPWIPAQLVASILLVVGVLVTAWFTFVQWSGAPERMDVAPSASVDPAAPVRLVVFGGSQTRGYPFFPGWPDTFTHLVEDHLRSHGYPRAQAFNLGVDAAGLDYIMEAMDEALRTYQPTHVIVNSVMNNAVAGFAATYRERLERFLSRYAGHVPQLILVKEPALEPVYHVGRWPSPVPYYEVLDEMSARFGVAVIDPLPVFDRHREEFLFMDDVHLTAHGHRLMAEILEEALAPTLPPAEAPPPPAAPPG